VAPYLTLLALGLLVALQSSLVPYAALGPAKPLLPLLAVVSWGLLRGPRAAAWWALALGVLMDFVSPAPFGFYSVPMLAAAAVTALGRGRLADRNVLVPGMAAAAATVSFFAIQRLGLAAILSRMPGSLETTWLWADIADELLPGLVLNLLWMPVLYFPLRALANRAAPPSIGWER
jgi:rod shape-determining protein MreD